MSNNVPRYYQALLLLYPASFRAEYGEEMRAVFARRQRDAAGLPSIAWLWIAALFETMRDAAAVHWDILRQDLRYTARTLGRSPGFALTAILVIALGVGANTAAFSVTDFVLIRPLAFPEPDRLVKLWENVPRYARMELSPGNYRDWKRMSRSFESMSAFTTQPVNLVGQGEPERIDAAAVMADFFPTLGVQPLMGRLFTAAEDQPGAAGTVVLSYRMWQSEFGGDPGIVGRSLNLDGSPSTVIGVMPREFSFPVSDTRLWIPAGLPEVLYQDRNNNFIEGVGRLKPGISLEQARAEMNVIAGQLERQYPKENLHTSATVNRLRDELSQKSRGLLWALSGAAICVLLIACINLANLLLARGMARQKELAVRTAIGAGRERLVRQMITESLLLAFAGGGLGVLVAVAALPLMARLVPSTLPMAGMPAIDARVLLFAGLLTLGTGIAFGVGPAWRMGRGADLSGLREGSRAGGGRKERLRSALVMAEIMASVVLLVSAGMLMRALWRVQATDPGFRTEGVLTMRTALPTPKYETEAARDRFYASVLSEVRRLPGVESAAYTSFLPMTMGGGIWPVSVKGEKLERAGGDVASMRFTTPGFFKTLRIPLLQGREPADSDTSSTPLVAVVSQSFVRKYWPDGNAIGRHFQFAFSDRVIVGVAADIRVRGLEQDSEPQVYLPYKQQGGNFSFYVPKDLAILTTGTPEALAPAVQRIIRAADPEQPVSNVRTMAKIVEEQTASRTVQARLLGGFAALAFLLAAVGIHGLLSFAVSQRSREIGVRVALGAKPRDILGMVLGQAAFVAVAGVLPGAVLAYQAGLAMQALLAGVKPNDPATFLAAAALCVAMTLFGSLLPAWRAVSVDPITALRAE
jgi:putative ABC transport system permease protein